jgi:hypothetical protein
MIDDFISTLEFQCYDLDNLKCGQIVEVTLSGDAANV